MSEPPVIDVPVDEPVTLINAFTVPVAESDHFLQRWKDNARLMASSPGFISARMHRSLVDEAELRFVNIAEWESGAALAGARANPAWRDSVRRMMDDPQLHITARPAVYEIALNVGPNDPL